MVKNRYLSHNLSRCTNERDQALHVKTFMHKSDDFDQLRCQLYDIS